MSEEHKPFEQIERILRKEELRLIAENRNTHILSAFERSIAHSLKALKGDSGDPHTAEGMASGKLGFPVEWCPYLDEGYPRENWLKGHRMGRIHREANPPSMPVLERLAQMFEARLRKNERDYEQHLIGMVARERRKNGELSSRIARAEKRVKQLEGRYGPEIDRPTMMLRFLIQPIYPPGGEKFRAQCRGLQGTKVVAYSKEEAAKGALQAALGAMTAMIEQGKEFDFECVLPASVEPGEILNA